MRISLGGGLPSFSFRASELARFLSSFARTLTAPSCSTSSSDEETGWSRIRPEDSGWERSTLQPEQDELEPAHGHPCAVLVTAHRCAGGWRGCITLTGDGETDQLEIPEVFPEERLAIDNANGLVDRARRVRA